MKTHHPQGDSRLFLFILISFLSGGCALAYEVLFVRALTMVLGDMFYVHAALLCTFMVGMGAGALLASRVRPWLWLAELLTGLYAIALPGICNWGSQHELAVLITAHPLRTVLTTIVFTAAPALMIGVIIPLISACLHTHTGGQRAFQPIYIAYNLGAWLSLFLVEWLLIRHLGLKSSLSVFGIINVLTAIALILMKASPLSFSTESAGRFSQRVVAALALAGICSSLFQMFFMKLSQMIFLPHRENFALALSVVLLGMFLGALLASRVKVPFETFLIMAAFSLGLIYLGYPLLVKLLRLTVTWSYRSDLTLVLYKFFFGSLFALVPMMMWGALLPALMREERDVARESGYVLCISCLANAAGYLGYVFWGHPLCPQGVLLFCLIVVMLGASLLAGGGHWLRYQKVLAVLSLVLGLLMMFSWRDRFFYLARWPGTLTPEFQVTTVKSGAENATLLHLPEIDWISYNGYPSIIVRDAGKVNCAEIMSAIIPALNAPRPEKALVMGLGSGITAGSAAQVFKHTDVAEINDAFVKMMPEFNFANMDILHNPAASVHLVDGRAFLAGKEKEYDAIINTTPGPLYFSATKLYTVEFYRRLARALKPDGVFSMWIDPSEMSEPGVLLVLSALRKSFPYCELRMMRFDYYMVTCSMHPLSPRQFSELTVGERVKKELALNFPLTDLDDLFRDIRLCDNLFAGFTPEVPRENTDDYPVLEFISVNRYQKQKMGHDYFMEHQAELKIDAVRLGETGRGDPLARRALIYEHLCPAYFERFFVPVLKEDHLSSVWYLFRKGELQAQKHDLGFARSLFEKAIELEPGFTPAYRSLGPVLQSLGKKQEALACYQKLLRLAPEDMTARQALKTLRQTP